MPGECVERQVFDLGDGETWALDPGDLLFEERFNRAALEQLSWDLGEGPYNAQILQRPSPPGGALFKLKYFQRYEKPPGLYELIVQSWDPAMVDTETTAFSVCTTLGHPWAEALPARRSAQAARCDPSHEGEVERRMRRPRNVRRWSGHRQRAPQAGGLEAMALSSRPETRQGRASDRPDAQDRTQARASADERALARDLRNPRSRHFRCRSTSIRSTPWSNSSPCSIIACDGPSTSQPSATVASSRS